MNIAKIFFSIIAAFLFVSAPNNLLGQDSTGKEEVTITGLVKDELGAAMVGVTIQNLRSGSIIATKDNGSFSIRALKGDSLVASYVGYNEYRWVFKDRIEIEITMDAITGSMNDVVVVGYGQQKKISLVGSQASVNVEELKIPVANLSAALAGRIAGLIGVQRSGLPGQNGADLWIRGISTIGGNASGPLIIVDGVQGRDLDNIDPEDVAAFTILKDASATAVYGVAGANGVVLITTKKGKIGKPTLMANYNQGIVAFTKTPELTDGITYMKLRNEAQLASGVAPEYSQAVIDSTLAGNQPYLYPNVDWMGELFNKTAMMRRLNFSARGGSESANYYVSMAYYDEDGLVVTDGLQNYNADTKYRRYNFTSNVNMDWTKTTKFELGIQGYISNRNWPGYNPEGIFGRVMQTNPVLYPTMYPGNLVPRVNQAFDAQPNPYAMATQSGYLNRFENQIYSNARVTQDLSFWVPGLSTTAMYSFDIWNQHDINRTRERSGYTIDKSNPYNEDGSLNLTLVSNGTDNLNYSRGTDARRQNYFEGSINYDHDIFNSKNHVTGLLLYNQRSATYANAGDLTASLPFRLQGFVGRATYSYDNRYFGEFNFGYNGSENFSPENRYGFFPSFGVAWVASNEKFFESLKDVLQYFKLRYSDGYVGAGGKSSPDDGLRRYMYLTIVNTNAGGYTFGRAGSGRGYGGTSISDYGTNVEWSVSHKQDLGVELKTLNSRVSLTVDFFKELRKGVFLQRNNIPDYVGLANAPFGNLGIVDNRGIDATLETTSINLGATSWDVRGTISYNRDKVIENGNPKLPYPYMEGRGVNLLSTFGYKAQGLFANQAEIDNSPLQTMGNPRPGDIKYKDLNGDGIIDANDITRIGNGDVPNLIYGFGFNVTWKGFYFGLFFQGTEGATRLIGGDGIIPFNNSTGAERSNLFAIAEDRWTVENPNPNAFYPRLAYGNTANKNNSVASSWWVKDVDFIRLKTADLGYNLPKGTLKSIALKNARIYIQGLNLLYWSKFELWDPELNTGNGTRYPNTRNIVLGLQANFL